MEEPEIKIGERVRKIRNERGLTLQDVANYTGFSKALISQIENNVVMPPINTLGKIAKILNVKMTYFFEEEIDHREYHIVRKDERKMVFREGVKHGYLYENLASMSANDVLQMILVTIKSGDGQKKLFNHEGYEYMYVAEGKIRFYLSNEIIDLEKGDSIAFNSKIPHYAESISEEDSKVVNALLKIDNAPKEEKE